MASNTPIEQLIAEYEAEMCDFSNPDFLVSSADRYVQTMDDSQVRCLLHAMANKLRKPVVVKPAQVPPNPKVDEVRPILIQALEKSKLAINKHIQNPAGEVQYSTHIRTSKRRSGKQRRLYFQFHCAYQYVRDGVLDPEDASSPAKYPLDLVRVTIKRVFRDSTWTNVRMYITSGTQYSFTARLVVEGDDDYAMWSTHGDL